MPSYNYYYFNIKGRGELPRLIFAAANVPFDDHRIEFKEWIQTYRHKMLLGQLPILEVDGAQLAQPKAIASFLAAEFGLAGATAFEAAECHALLDCVGDMASALFEIVYNKKEQEDAKAEKIAEYREHKLKDWLKLLESYFVEHVGDSGFVVGNKLTIADLGFVNIWDLMADVKQLRIRELLASYGALDAHCKRVQQLPRVAEYFAHRSQQATA